MNCLQLTRRITLTLTFSLFLILLIAGPAQGDMVMLSPVVDTYVDSDNPTSAYGQDVFLISRFDARSDRLSQPFLKFDLSLIPSGSTINEATLKLYLKDMTGRNSVEIEAFRATSDWDEAALTWNNRPTGPGLEKTATISDNRGNKNVDMTAFVSGWLANTFPNYGVFLDYKGKATYSAVFNSREAPKNQPYLVVYYNPPASGSGTPSVGLSIAEGKAPAIMEVNVSDIKNSSVTITWMTDMKADSKVKFGRTAAYDYETRTNKDVTAHSITLRGLSPGTVYHYRVFSKSPADLEASSADLEFKTSGQPAASTILPSTPFGWLKLIGIIAGAISLFLLVIVSAAELQHWRYSRSS
ncbi:MAG: DNRLRE domain-containing protein [Actinomycetota bacterium]